MFMFCMINDHPQLVKGYVYDTTNDIQYQFFFLWESAIS